MFKVYGSLSNNLLLPDHPTCPVREHVSTAELRADDVHAQRRVRGRVQAVGRGLGTVVLVVGRLRFGEECCGEVKITYRAAR